MRLTSYSTYNLTNLTRDWIAKDQNALIKARYEAVHGRHYDMSDTLGYKVGRLLNIQMHAENLNFYKTSNDLLKGRLDTAQHALESLTNSKGKNKGTLQAFLDTVLASHQDVTSRVAAETARGAIRTFISVMNSSFNGRYVFSGLDDDPQQMVKPPFKDYEPGDAEDPISKEMQKLFADFVDAKCGGDIKKLTPELMDQFLDGEFAKKFEGDEWKRLFSNASDKLETNRISENGESVTTGISANNQGFRAAMKALVMIAEFDHAGVPKKVLSHMEQKASEIMAGKAVIHIIADQSELGVYQTRIVDTNRFIDTQLAVLNNADHELGSVDPAEASTRLQALETALNISFQMTSRISKLSLAQYI